MKVRYKFLDRSIFFYINIKRETDQTVVIINSNLKKSRKSIDITLAYGKLYFKYGRIKKIIIPKNDNYIYCIEYINGKSITHDIYVDPSINVISLDASITPEKDELVLRVRDQ